MSNRGRWLQGGITLADCAWRALSACLFVAWVLMIAARALQSPPSVRPGCGTDPWDFLRVGEILESSSLAFLVKAHCKGAKYSPHGWIELSHGGGRVDVEVRRIDIGGETYLQVVAIGGVDSAL